MFTKRAEDCAQPQSPGSFASGSIVLSLFGAAGWIITRMDTRIDRLDTRIDTLAVEIATMRGQLDFLARIQLGDQPAAATETAPGQ